MLYTSENGIGSTVGLPAIRYMVTTLQGVGGYPDRDALADNTASAFGWALQQGMLSAEDGYLRPGALVSRGQLAIALAKLLEITA